MSPFTYTTLHVAGIMLMFTAIGGLAVLAAVAGTETDAKPIRRYLTIVHGVALLVILVAGFGLMAKKLAIGGPGEWPVWLWIKLALWFVLGGSTVLLRRQPGLMRPMVIVLPGLGLLATYLALYKPL